MHTTSILVKLTVGFAAKASLRCKASKEYFLYCRRRFFRRDIAIIWDKETKEISCLKIKDMDILVKNEELLKSFSDYLFENGAEKNHFGIPPLDFLQSFVLFKENIKSEKDFWVKYRHILKLSNSTENSYTHLEIPKKSGGSRRVYRVDFYLKSLQRLVLVNILEQLPCGAYAYAYRKGRSVLGNAALHTGKNVLVKLDIKSFFDSITYSKVYGVFAEYTGYPKPVLTFLTKICTLNNRLPQGAVTSPALSNLVMAPIDEKIAEWCSGHSITYSRYCDDMAFSGSFDPGRLIYHIKKLLGAYGFELNGEKSIVAKQGMCQNVTGIVVNNKPRVDKEYTRKIRQEMYYIEKLGVEQHLRNMKPARFVTAKRVLKVNYMKSLLGRINYALFINPNDSEMGKYKYSVTEWLKRNSSYDDGLKEKRDDDLFSFYLDENLPF